MKLKALATVATTTITSIAFAHPGHDHSDISAVPIHLAYYGSIAGIVALAAYGVYYMRKKSAQKTTRKDSE
ncbi:hypothetical protein KRX19_01855 [Cardiobacteriaceae bacterium TAE3-ERU3]|nr:hypothetical protein [Cardiobacteriaceae bacterium TAE3-ERU3]